METRKYLVEVVCRQRSLYEVEAEGNDAAERVALQRWQRGDASDVPGLESCRVEGVRATHQPDEIRARQDEEVLLRFVQERERLLRRWGNGRFDLSESDAISANQIAADLGWFRTDVTGEGRPDVIRAAQGMERLCQRRELVGFERSRSRGGERGTIRLYCTPEYLDRLSESVEDPFQSRARPA